MQTQNQTFENQNELKPAFLANATPGIATSGTATPVAATPPIFQPKKYQIKYIKNEELHENLKVLVQRERKLTHTILLHIMEVDRRRLYLKMAHPSLWDYLIKGIGYSAPSAQRRIEAARLMNHVPELGNKIEAGTVNLSQVAVLQKTLRDAKKSTKVQISPEQKQELVARMENKTAQETQILLAQAFQIPVEIQETSHKQRDLSTRVEMTFTDEEMKVLQQARSLLSHALARSPNKGFGLKDMMLYWSRKTIQQKLGVKL